MDSWCPDQVLRPNQVLRHNQSQQSQETCRNGRSHLQSHLQVRAKPAKPARLLARLLARPPARPPHLQRMTKPRSPRPHSPRGLLHPLHRVSPAPPHGPVPDPWSKNGHPAKTLMWRARSHRPTVRESLRHRAHALHQAATPNKTQLLLVEDSHPQQAAQALLKKFWSPRVKLVLLVQVRISHKTIRVVQWQGLTNIYKLAQKERCFWKTHPRQTEPRPQSNKPQHIQLQNLRCAENLGQASTRSRKPTRPRSNLTAMSRPLCQYCHQRVESIHCQVNTAWLLH